MTVYQWLIVACAVLLNANDGFDVAAMSFVAANVEREFDLSGSVLGTVISATLVGMAIGALVIGRLADILGRRWTVVGSAVLSTVGMFLAATSQDVVQLGVWRVLTGIGVGGILASITVITSEFSSARWRGLAIGVYTAGYGVGAFLGGMAANGLQTEYGWRSVFFVGASVSVFIVLALAIITPESVQFLLTRRPRYADKALARIAKRVGYDPAKATVAQQVDESAPREASSRLSDLFTRKVIVATLLLWLAFFTVMFGFYFVNSWTPRLMGEAGMSDEQGVYIGMALAIGGTIGSVLYGVIAARIEREKLALAFLVISAIAIIAFVLSTAMLTIAMILGVVVGLLVNGCIAGMYSIAPTRYAASARGTGVGAALAVGRIGAILAPMFGGAMLDAGWTLIMLYASAAVMLLIGAVAVLLLRRIPEVGGAS
ncbi:major facilitator superfamily permease [Microbacterium album]|uniref:Major facilitator superfamily permease n=2 Tax=Microbacterium album TaxID=2053191 RepID=A0A917IGA5_9MICO|nr:major facilitator superfamily permease [Microbacterium album]